MKIFFVMGGKYKSFYLNVFLKIKPCDMLIINIGIMYDLKQEDLKENIVAKELLFLHQKIKVPIIAGIKVGNKRERRLIFCANNEVKLYKLSFGLKCEINNKEFIVGNEFTKYGNCNKIVLTHKKLKPNFIHCSKRKIYLFCNNSGVIKVEKGKILRKFYKYAKIILK